MFLALIVLQRVVLCRKEVRNCMPVSSLIASNETKSLYFICSLMPHCNIQIKEVACLFYFRPRNKKKEITVLI
jgi:hypothetical protein